MSPAPTILGLNSLDNTAPLNVPLAPVGDTANVIGSAFTQISVGFSERNSTCGNECTVTGVETSLTQSFSSVYLNLIMCVPIFTDDGIKVPVVSSIVVVSQENSAVPFSGEAVTAIVTGLLFVPLSHTSLFEGTNVNVGFAKTLIFAVAGFVVVQEPADSGAVYSYEIV